MPAHRIVIPYEKTCDETTGHCLGTAGDGGTIEMQGTSFQTTGKRAQTAGDRVDHRRRNMSIRTPR